LIKLKKNLIILNEVNNLFVQFIKSNPDINIDYIKSNLSNHREIFSNQSGKLTTNSENITIQINTDKTTGKFHLVDFGFTKIKNIELNNSILNKYKIPNFDSILNFSDNIKHIFKTLKIFSTNSFKISTKSLFNKLELDKILFEDMYDTIKQVLLNDSIFKSDEKYMLYVKIFDTSSNAFFIDKTDKLMYYITSLEKHSVKNPSVSIFYYVFELDHKYKIINHNKSKNIIKYNNSSYMECYLDTNCKIIPDFTPNRDNKNIPGINSIFNKESESEIELIPKIIPNQSDKIINPNIVEFQDSNSSDYEYFKNKYNFDIPKSNIKNLDNVNNKNIVSEFDNNNEKKDLLRSDNFYY